MLPMARKKLTLYYIKQQAPQDKNTSIQQRQSAKLNDKTNGESPTTTRGKLLDNWPKLFGLFKNLFNIFFVYLCLECHFT